MADVVRIVDSIAASPTVLLDLNDEVSWWTKAFRALPPRLRRSVAQNSLRDGDYDAASSYGPRVLEIELESIESTQDDAASQLQTLFRLLDTAAGRFLQYQPQGASKPVFFVLRRSDLSDLVDVMAQAAMRTLTVELNAEPFALGLRESLGPHTLTGGTLDSFTIPAADALGDVPAPLLVSHAYDGVNLNGGGWIGVRGERTTSLITLGQCESMIPWDADTTDPGGGPDAAMSGTDTNNYLSTSFATSASLSRRIRWQVSAVTAELEALRGRFQVLAVVRASDGTSTFGIQAQHSRQEGRVVTPVETTLRQVVALGSFEISGAVDRMGGYGPLTRPSTAVIDLYAERTAGAGSLHWDQIRLVPSDGGVLVWKDSAGTSGTIVIDAANERVYSASDAAIAAGEGAALMLTSEDVSGGFPFVTPNADNLVAATVMEPISNDIAVGRSDTFNAYYYPRYLFVRPMSS